MGTWNPDKLCPPDKSCPPASSALPSGAEYTAVAWPDPPHRSRPEIQLFPGRTVLPPLGHRGDVSNPGGLPALRSLPGARVTRARTVRMAASPADRQAAIPMPLVPVARLGQSQLGTPATPRSTWRAFGPSGRGPEAAPRSEAKHARRPLIAPVIPAVL